MKKRLPCLLGMLLLFFQCLSAFAEPRLLPGENFTPDEIKQIVKKYGDNFDMVENLRVQNILKKALKTSPGISFRTELHEIKLPGNIMADRCSFQRYVSPDGTVFRRMDCFDKQEKELYSFIQNQKGHYAKIQGHWFKISELMTLWYFDAMAEGINYAEAVDCIYTVTEEDYQGIPCYKVCVRNVPNYNLFYRQIKEMPIFVGQEGLAKNREIGSFRPVLRIFYIGIDNSFIYARQHYNVRGGRVYNRNVGEVEIGGKFSEKDFLPTGKIEGDYLFRAFAEEELWNRQRVSIGKARQNKSNTPTWHSRFFEWLFEENTTDIISIVVLSVASVMIVLIIVLKKLR